MPPLLSEKDIYQIVNSVLFGRRERKGLLFFLYFCVMQIISMSIYIAFVIQMIEMKSVNGEGILSCLIGLNYFMFEKVTFCCY